MATIIRTEKRKRGLFGTIAWWTFLAFNALMVLSAYIAMSGASKQFQGSSDEAYKAGTVLGGSFLFAFIMMIWVFGDFILGMIVLLSRGKTVITEQVQE